jgi:hypothetical protein
MLTLLGGTTRYCDGITRRAALKIGAFSFGATTLTLADVYRAEAVNKGNDPAYSPTQHKAIINVFLGGGPPHQDMWDIKTEAPDEIRGEFKPISTKVPGIQIGECFPKIAAMADKFAFIRSVVGAKGGHDAYQCTTGWEQKSLAAMGGRPSVGSVLGRLYGPTDPSVPPFVGLAETTKHVPWSDPGQVGFLGSTYSAFKPSGPDLANMKVTAINQENLADRKKLLAGFDHLRRELDASGTVAGADAHTRRALDVLTSSKLLDAMDLNREDPRVRDRYKGIEPFLTARRLIEAGVGCVTLSYGGWDTHGSNFKTLKRQLPDLDRGIANLVQDLHDRGLQDDVATVVWGEFGRTPKVNGNDGGRDHWAPVMSALVAGGGLKMGQAIGASSARGEYAKDRPYKVPHLLGTLYRAVGIDPSQTFPSGSGRPMYVLDDRDAVTELA